MSVCPLGRPSPKHGHLLKAAKLHQCILLLVLTHAILAAACSRSSLKGSGSLVVTKKDDTEKKQKLIDEIVAILELYTDEKAQGYRDLLGGWDGGAGTIYLHDTGAGSAELIVSNR